MPTSLLHRLAALATLAAWLAACGGGNTPAAAPTAANGGPAATATLTARSANLTESMAGVEIQASEAGDWRAASAGDPLAVGGAVRTDAQARAKLTISDGAILRLAPNTLFRLTELEPAPTDAISRFRLEVGKVFVALGGALGTGTFEIDTPNGVAAVRGSIMSAEFFPADGRMIVTCLEGACRIVAPNGKYVDLPGGTQSGIPAYGKDPGKVIAINAAQLQSWADEFPEAAGLVRQVTPGPEPSPTPGAGNGGASGGSGGAAGYVSQTACDHPYFPLRTGATWTYDNDGLTSTWTVLEVVGDRDSATASMQLDFGEGQMTWTWECQPDGVVSYQYGALTGMDLGQFAEFTVDQAGGTWLPAAGLLQVGYAWENSYATSMKMTLPGQEIAMSAVTRLSQQLQVAGMDPVTFGGQTYPGLQIAETSQMSTEYTGAITLPGVDFSSTGTTVLALGVGIVRTATTSEGISASSKLVSFNIP